MKIQASMLCLNRQMKKWISRDTFKFRLLFLLIFTGLSAQFSYGQIDIKTKHAVYQKIYKLDQEQFKRLYQYKSVHDSLDLFTHYVKRIPIHQTNVLDSLPFGHYLAIKVTGTQLNFRVYSKPFFKLQSHGINGKVWYIITNTEGNVLTGAKLNIRDSTYTYQPDCNCYSVPANLANGQLTISYLDHYEILKSSFSYRQQAQYQVKSNEYKKERWSNVRILPGYVAFNQPMYRQNDTVRTKAFLVNEKGKPWKRKKVLMKYTTPGQKVVVLGVIRPQTEGAYVRDFVVSDTHSLGTYHLSYWNKRGKVKLRDERFRIEDYHLNPSNTYHSRVTQPVYHRGQDVEFILKAEDVNGLALLDAKARVSVVSRQFNDFYDKHFFWNGQQNFFSFEREVLFDVAGETVVRFEDSLFPNNNMIYRATITYFNDLEQLYSNVIDFTFDAKPNHFEFRLKGDSIVVDHFTLGVNSPHSGLQLISMRDNEIVDTKSISAPYREKIDLFNTTYILKDKHNREINRLNFNNHHALPVSLNGSRTHDSIRIRLDNSLQMPVSYQVFKGNQQVDGGRWEKGKSQLLYSAADSSLDDYHVFYSVLWRHKHFIKEQYFYVDETKLNVAINQPDIVFPGSRVPVEVNITDYQNKNVEGVNVTAYSVNDLFNTIPLPQLPYFGRLHSGFLSRFNVNLAPLQFHRNITLQPEHIDQFDLREIPYYGFAYAKNGVGIFRDSIDGDLAELAVYGLKMNSHLSIHAIYLNDEPVAINGTSNRGAYVFVKPAGEYDLKIRTSSHQYTINNVKLTKGEKAYLCFNEAFAESNPDVSYIKIDQAPFTKDEWAYLKPHFLYINWGRDRYVIEQDGFLTSNSQMTSSSGIYDQNKWYSIVGPVKKGKVQVYNQTRDTILTFDFYPDYLYSMDSIGNIIVDKPAPNERSAFRFSLNSRHQDWDFNYRLQRWADLFPEQEQEVQKPEPVVKTVTKKTKINFDNPARASQLRSFRPEKFREKSYGGLSLKNNTGKIMKWVLLVSQDDPESSGAWYTSQFNTRGFTPGNYDVMVCFQDSSYVLLQDFEIRKKGIDYYRLDSNEVKEPDLKVQLYYEEIIVAANQSPLNVFVNNPLYFKKIHLKTMKSQRGQTVVSGYIVNTYNRPVNNINLIFEKAGRFKYGALTNQDGYFELTDIEPGTYTIKIGNALPYRVYEDLKVKRGINTRVVIGNDPALRLNSDGELEVVEEAPLPEPIYDQVYTSGSYSNNADYAYESNVQASAINRAYSYNSRKLMSLKLPANTFESTIYPGIDQQEYAITNQIDDYAKQKGLDRATMEMIRQNDSLNRIRDTYRDYAYWVPNLVTDKDGNARFTVQFPDNITRWKTIVPAMNDKKQTGIGVKYAQAFKPLSSHLGMPSFVITGDSIELEGKILNYTNDTLQARTWFKVNSDTVYTGYQSTNRTVSEQYKFSWSEPEAVELAYGLMMSDGYLDGEIRPLNVLSNSIEQIKGELKLLDQDSILTINPDGNKKSVYVFNKPLGLYETEINKLKQYRYGCNEQTASKLKALILEKKMAKALDQPFEEEKMIKTCIDILTKNQMTDGSYGWWGRAETDLWVTVYVLDALNKAAEYYNVGDYMTTARYLKDHLSGMQVSDRLMALNTLAAMPYPMNYKPYIAGLDTINLSLRDEFRLLFLKQQQGNPVSISKVLDSYIETPEGVFWGEELFNGHIHQWSTSALAYKILKQYGERTDLMDKMRDYFLQLNPEGRNTIERATLLDLFLEDELTADNTLNEFKGDVWINGQKIESFPFFKAFNPNDTINIKKTGKRVNVQVNTHSVETNPQGNDSLVVVKRKFIQAGVETDSLTTGMPVTLTVDVEVKADMKYVLLEIPVPASCIYTAKKARTNNYESYRENFRRMTAISCASLPKGKHQFSVQLLPRFEGSFNTLPVKVEEMYAPVNANYSDPGVIWIKKG